MDEPVVRVVRGEPTAEEIAALLGALLVQRTAQAAAAGADPAAERRAPSGWRMSALPTTPPHPGPGAWRASGLPR